MVVAVLANIFSSTVYFQFFGDLMPLENRNSEMFTSGTLKLIELHSFFLLLEGKQVDCFFPTLC